MNRDRTIPALTIFLLVGILTFLFYQTKTNDIPNHHQTLANIQGLAYQDSLLNESILVFRAGQYSNYDPLTQQEQNIKRYLRWFKSPESGIKGVLGDDIDQAIDDADIYFEKKISLTERFKSHNGILKNSLHYLPTAVSNSQDDQHGALHHSDLNHLLREVLLYNSRPNEQNKFQAYQLIDKLRNTQSQNISQLTLHAEKILEERLTLQNIVDELFSLPTKKSVDEIYLLYGKYNAMKKNTVSSYRTLMYTMALLLIVYVLYLFISLRKTMYSLEDTLYEVEFQKNALDKIAIVAIISSKKVITYVNEKYCHTSQYCTDEIVGQSWSTVESNYHPGSFFTSMWETLDGGDSWNGEIRSEKKDGSHYWVDATIVPFLDKLGNPLRYVALLTDITEKKLVDNRIYRLAHHDALTDLPNRAQFFNCVENALPSAAQSGEKISVIFLDLDNFKLVNDTMGHASGDILLQTVAEHLRSSVQESDIVARLGGDEFTIALFNIKSSEQIEAIAERILSIIKKPINLEGKDIVVTTSVGISVFPDDASDVDTLLKNADIAMYRAKSNGKNKYEFFTEELLVENSQRHEMENDLQLAIQHEQFELHYQPQVVTESGEICAVEALLRWNHPEKGLIPPDVFIPVLEDSGLIVEVGKWVLMEACAQLARLKESGFDIRMAVNVSARQIRDDHMLDLVRQIISFRPIQPHELELELTETSLMNNSDCSIDMLTELSDIGVGLALDDFGTGYSSLSYLKKLPVNTLKIDKSFVRDIPDDQHDMAIATTIIAMAESLGLKVVAEGVETAEQLHFLQESGCDYLQGYYFSKPVTAEVLQQLLNEKRAISDQNTVVRLTR